MIDQHFTIDRLARWIGTCCTYFKEQCKLTPRRFWKIHVRCTAIRSNLAQLKQELRLNLEKARMCARVWGGAEYVHCITQTNETGSHSASICWYKHVGSFTRWFDSKVVSKPHDISWFAFKDWQPNALPT